MTEGERGQWYLTGARHLPGGIDAIQVQAGLRFQAPAAHAGTEIEVVAGLRMDLTVSTEGLARQRPVVVVLANGFQRPRCQLPGQPTFVEREQLAAMVDQAGVGRIGRKSEDIFR